MLSKRELESRYEVFIEQYAVKLNIEAETAASIARTLLLPAAVRHLAELRKAGLEELIGEMRGRWSRSFARRRSSQLEDVNLAATSPTSTASGRRSTCATGAAGDGDVREVADRLERIVADDLWPLPKYSEMLFIK